MLMICINVAICATILTPIVAHADIPVCGDSPGPDCAGTVIYGDAEDSGFGFSGGFNGAGQLASQNGRFEGDDSFIPYQRARNKSSPDDKTKSDPNKNCTSAHPVVIENGNKVYPVKDIKYSGEYALELKRNYDKNYSRVGSFGEKWPSTLDLGLQFNYAGGSHCSFSPGTSQGACPVSGITSITSLRSSGEEVTYTFNNTVLAWTTAPNLSYPRIVQNGATWVLTNADRSTEVYTNTGAISSIVSEYKIAWTFNYNGNLLSSITHPSGRSISFTWENRKVRTAQDSDGHQFLYSYDGNGYLSSVKTGVGDIEGYVYEDPAQQGGLTGTFYNGKRYGRYSYYPDGTVATSGLDGSVDTQTFTYTPDNGSGKKYTTVKNVRGAVSTYEFDLIANHYVLARISRTGVSGCPNQNVITAYDTYGFPFSKTDAAGNISYYRYASSGLIGALKVGSGSDEQTYSYEWDLSRNLLKSVKRYPPGSGYFATGIGNPDESVDYEYIPDGMLGARRLKTITMKNLSSIGIQNQQRITSYSYQFGASGFPTQIIVTPPAHSDIVYSYFDNGDLQQVKNSFGHHVDYANYNGFGLAKSVKNENNQLTNYDFDEIGRLKYVGKTRDGVLVEKTFEYNSNDQVTKVVNKPTGVVTQFTFDSLFRLSSVTNNAKDLITYSYSNLSKPDSESYYDLNGGLRRKVRYGYDEVGNLVGVYGNYGQVITYTYDAKDRRKTVSDTMGNQYEYSYNGFDQVTSIKNPNGDVAQINYDGTGQVALISDYRNIVTRYIHDGLGNQVTLNSPDAGTYDETFDSSGRILTIRYPDSSVMNYRYDDIGRLKFANLSSGSGTSRTYLYDNCTGGFGRICSAVSNDGATNGSETVSFSYTGDGQVATQTLSSRSGKYTSTLAWTYTPDNNVSTVTYPDNKVVSYSYDTSGRLSSVKLKGGILGGDSFVAVGFTYEPFGPESGYVLGSDELRSLTYDSDGRLRAIRSGAVQDVQYSFDTANRMYLVNDNINKYSKTIGYDNLNRFRSASSPYESLNLILDANSNLTQQTSGGSSTVFTPDTYSNRLVYKYSPSQTAYLYDTRGNIRQTADGSPLVLTYDAFNQVTSIVRNGTGLLSSPKTTTYAYDAFGNRTLKSGSGLDTRFSYAQGGILYAEKGLSETDYVWANGKIIAMVRGGSIDFIHNDHLGRPEVITSSNKVILWKANNLTFDRSVSRNLIGQFNIGFPGQYFDSESGLYYNVRRYYDPASGRYLQNDPIGQGGGLNPYVYAGGNPISNIDPNGSLCLSNAEIQAISFGIGTALSGASVGGLPGFGYGLIGGAVAGYIAGSIQSSNPNSSGNFIANSFGGVVAGAAGGVDGGGIGIVAGGVGGGISGTGSGAVSVPAPLNIASDAAFGFAGGSLTFGITGIRGVGAAYSLSAAIPGGIITAVGAGLTAGIYDFLTSKNDCGCGK